MEGQVQEGVRGDRDHGEPQQGSAGERFTCPRRRALPGTQLEERGAVISHLLSTYSFVLLHVICIIYLPSMIK